MDNGALLFDPNSYALAISHPADHAVGTAFLGRLMGEVALYTAAHVLAAGALVAWRYPKVDEWNWVAKSVSVHIDLNPHGQTVNLVTAVDATADGDDAALRPAFDHLTAPHDDEAIWDVARFDATTASLLHGSFDHFGIVDLDDAPALQVGTPLVAVGFPPVDLNLPQLSWPYSPAARLTGTILGISHGHYLASFASQKGFSGGPVFTQDGHFVGLLTGNDQRLYPPPRRDLTRIVPREVLMRLTAPGRTGGSPPLH